ncbi:MAG: hypothetical protein HYV42_02605 [Candidatus Magasanikbacteria bacterium]|nr:hypothetical protein [Candidatus Magasanikbacteria bacterium]
MNKFAQVVLTLCALVWLLIGLVIIAALASASIFLARLKPLQKLQQLSPALQMLQQLGGGGSPSFGSLGGSRTSLSNLDKIGSQLSSPQFLSCARTAIGAARVAELSAKNALPTTAELLKLAPCLK